MCQTRNCPETVIRVITKSSILGREFNLTNNPLSLLNLETQTILYHHIYSNIIYK